MLSDGQLSKLESQGITVERVGEDGYHIDSSLAGLRKLMTFLMRNNFRLSPSRLRSLPAWKEHESYNERAFIIAPALLPAYSKTLLALIAYFESTPIGSALTIQTNNQLHVDMPMSGLVRLSNTMSWSITLTKSEQAALQEGQVLRY